MPEKLTLAAPVVQTSLSEVEVVFLLLNKFEKKIEIRLQGNTKELLYFYYEGPVALNLMIALNKANLSLKSLERRIIEKLMADGKLAGAIVGAPD